MRKQQSRYGGQGVVAKRYYDPEERRQRRAGQGQALLGGSGAVSAGYGAYGIQRDTRATRAKIKNIVNAANENADALRNANERLDKFQQPKGNPAKVALMTPKDVKGLMRVRPRNAAMLVGGAGGIGAAYLTGRHMNSNRGRGWN